MTNRENYIIELEEMFNKKEDTSLYKVCLLLKKYYDPNDEGFRTLLERFNDDCNYMIPSRYIGSEIGENYHGGLTKEENWNEYLMLKKAQEVLKQIDGNLKQIN